MCTPKQSRKIQRNILSFFNENSRGYTALQIAELAEISINQSFYYLKKLEKTGKIRKLYLSYKNVIWHL